MIDKLVLTPLYNYWDAFPRLEEFARQLRLQGYDLSLQTRGFDEAGTFYFVQGINGVYFKVSRLGHVLRIYTNPSRFSSFDEYRDFLGQITPPGFSLADITRISRIDYATRINQDFDDVVRGIDVKYKQQLQRYQSSGRERTGIYFGSNPDIVSIYNESHYLLRNSRRQQYDPENTARALDGERFTKIERQVSQPARIKRLAGITEDLTLHNLRPHLVDIAEDRVTPLSSVTLQNISVRSHRELTTVSQIRRAARLEGALEMSSYGDVRRRFNTHNNFPRTYLPLLDVVRLPDREQPTHLLKQSLRRHLGLPILRRQPPQSISATVA